MVQHGGERALQASEHAALVGRVALPRPDALVALGEAGVARAFAILRDELERGLALMGVATPDALTRSHVGRVR